MEKEFFVKDQNETIKLGYEIGKLLKAGDVILLEGDLSSGKTTLTKGIGKALGVTRVINSPTFTIVKEYSGSSLKLYHMDLYRLDGLNNDFDLFEYFEGDGVCVVEWPHQVDELLPSSYLLLRFHLLSEFERKIEVISVGKKYDHIVGDLNVSFSNR